jgi:hypothetical protein
MAECCPRSLNEQVNLVKAVGAALQKAGYDLTDNNEPQNLWPSNSGLYDPARDLVFKNAVVGYKQSHGLYDGDGITYQFVKLLLGVDLFKRW